MIVKDKSQESNRKSIAQSPASERNKGIMTLLSEFSRIGQLILSKAQAPWAKWHLSWKAEEDESENFSCTLTTNYAKEEHILLSLHLDAQGRSYLEAGIKGDTVENKGIRTIIMGYLKSTSTNKYFKLKDDKSAIIQADIHRKDIGSRNFEDYIVRLIDNMEPILSIFLSNNPNSLRLV